MSKSDELILLSKAIFLSYLSIFAKINLHFDEKYLNALKAKEHVWYYAGLKHAMFVLKSQELIDIYWCLFDQMYYLPSYWKYLLAAKNWRKPVQELLWFQLKFIC